MHRPSVVGMFVLEGPPLGLTASSTGAGVACFLCVLLRDTVPLPEAISHLFFSGTSPAPSLLEVSLAVLLVTVGAGLASIIPAARAASLSPRSAMESL